MKLWFKYRYGFVNIDEENIYFTNTGVWADAYKQHELSTPHIKTRQSYLYGIIVPLISMVSYESWKKIPFFLSLSITNQAIIVTIVILSLIGLYKIHVYLNTERGQNLKIPRSKIISTKPLKSGTAITFLNAENKEVSFYIKGLGKSMKFLN